MVHHIDTLTQAHPFLTSTNPLLFPSRCPRCNDDLALYHARCDVLGTPRAAPRHFLGCKSYPRCSYTADYDAHLLALMHRLGERLLRCEAHNAWLTQQIEVLRELVQEVYP